MSTAVANPYVLGSHDGDAVVQVDPVFGKLVENEDFGAYMFPTQPPAIEYRWILTCGKAIESATPKRRQAREGEEFRCRARAGYKGRWGKGHEAPLSFGEMAYLLEKYGMAPKLACKVDWSKASVHLGKSMTLSEVLDSLDGDGVVMDESTWRLLESGW